jgi:hypothetical protein
MKPSQKGKHKPSPSRDYPLYEKMKFKTPKGAVFWMAGDRLYHMGLLLTMLSIPALFFIYSQWGTGEYLVWAGGGLLASICLAALGIFLKRESYKLAMKAGIDITRI